MFRWLYGYVGFIFLKHRLIFRERSILHRSIQDFTETASLHWPCATVSLELLGEETEEDHERMDRFLENLSNFLDGIQEKFNRMSKEDTAQCGMQRIAVVIAIKVDTAGKEIMLDKLYKYRHIEYHLFTGLLQILQQNFQDYLLIVPSLRGYQLAREIGMFLGSPEIGCVYVKGDKDERLLMGPSLAGLTFESIMEDTEKHYEERSGMGKKVDELRCGQEVSMYHQGPDGEEEVLSMEVKVSLSRPSESHAPLHAIR
jgi:hypothetical protein